MEFGCADFSTVLNCILDAAADHLRIAKILVQMGLDPSNITYDTLFDRLTEIALAYVTFANMFALGWCHPLCRYLADEGNGAAARREYGRLYILRRFGALSGNVATFLLHLLLLPINAVRLRQMLKLVRKARSATVPVHPRAFHIGGCRAYGATHETLFHSRRCSVFGTTRSGLSMLRLTCIKDGPTCSRTPPRSDRDGSTADALEMGNFRTWPGGHVRL
jgi:hypothetical protein